MKCPECNSANIRRNGIKRGKQNHICYDCRRQFVIHNDQPPGYSDEIKQECLKMYVNGMGFRAIERVKGVHHTTIILWVKQVGGQLPAAYAPETDGWSVYPRFIPEGDQIVSKTYMTRVEGENCRLRHYLARLHRKTLCYSKSVEMLAHSIRLLVHYLKFKDVPVPQAVIP